MTTPALAPSYPIQTERLLLRPLDASDHAAMLAYRSRPDVCAYIPPEPATAESMKELLADPERTRSVLDQPGQALLLGVVRRDTAALIGDVNLFWHSAEHRSGEIGYVLDPDHQGNGYATEAARAVLGLAFDGLGLHRVTARIEDLNPASARVLRRLGMRQEAVLVENEWFKGRWSTEVDFAMLDREWRELSREA